MLSIGFTVKAGTDAVAVGVRPGPILMPTAQAADKTGMISRVLAGAHNFAGEDDDVLPICTPSGWLVLVGLGEADGQNAARLRRIGGNLFQTLAEDGIKHLDVALDLDPSETAEVAYGMRLRAWRPAAHYRSKPDPETVWTLVSASLVTRDPVACETSFGPLAARATAADLARDLVVAPANELTPDAFVKRLQDLGEQGIDVEDVDLRRHRLPLLQAVGQGSSHPPRLVVLRWMGGRDKDRPIVLVGKGITFDAGGLSIKPAEDMEEMKGDMAGAAAVAGAVYAAALRRARVNVVGVLAIAENMPSGTAGRPGDVVVGHAGLSVEIIDADAEGRLILADALSFAAERFKPRLMIDLATLTGAVEVALGHHRAGLFCSDDLLAESLLAAGEAEEEPLWRLPLTEVYDEALKSAVADLRNCVWEDGPDALHAARFLQHFVPEQVPWAHIDIAGVSEAEEDGPLGPEGATGFGIRLLDHLVADGSKG
ncbi:leucyl aminopeptidase [Telmatospirillum sp.]|uniref:leucyl aminopeptidase n=1 Tax=Telmatospirillum sp. TaxID=2079197 RepID=UPI0028502350|nr:leucyl aminopeptidase [Telmatospirillum sp.]MDR3440629.1 leucyl aminopeptidase [Telmatospirillum sp.]